MLSIIKKADLTHDILLNNNELNELKSLTLPGGWWHTTISHDLEEPKPILELIKFNKHKKGRGNSPLFPKTDYWDVKNGDYRVSETYTKPYAANSEYKKVIAFAHFSFTVILTIATVIFILSQIAKV